MSPTSSWLAQFRMEMFLSLTISGDPLCLRSRFSLSLSGRSQPPSFQLDHSASRCGSLCTHPSKGSLSFLNVQILVFCQVCRVNGHSSFQHSLCLLFSCSKISMRCPSAQLMRPQEFLRIHISSFFSWHWMISSHLVSSLWILSSACSKSATKTL